MYDRLEKEILDLIDLRNLYLLQANFIMAESIECRIEELQEEYDS